MKTAEEVFLSVLEKELDFVAEDKLKSTARALVDRLGMEHVKFFDFSCDAKDLVLSPKLEFSNPQTKVYDMDLTMEDILRVEQNHFHIDTFYLALLKDYFEVLGDGAHNTLEISKPDYIKRFYFLREVGEFRAQHIPEALNKVCAALHSLHLEADEQNQKRFEIMVRFLAETKYHAMEEICDKVYDFEQVIEETGLGEASFGSFSEDLSEDINFLHTGGYRHSPKARFFADYDDGNSAPVNICEWYADFEKLEELLKQTSPTLYEMYQDRLRKEREESTHENPCK